MKRTEYACDVCGDVVRKQGPGPDVRSFIGLELGLMGDHCKATDRFVAKDPHYVDRHLCFCCLAGLVSLARRTLPDQILKDALGSD